MKIKLYYNDIELGNLSLTNNQYLWSANASGIDTARKAYPYGMEMFFLPNFSKTYSRVPYHFNEFLAQATRPDLAAKAHILQTDSDIEKLFKLSKLNYCSQEFVIKS